MNAELMARIIAGEAGICGPLAWLAVAWVYQRNKTFYARGEPTPDMVWLAENWWRFPDPTRGATYLVNDRDLRLPVVRRFTVDRGPPTAVFICSGGRRLYAFGGDAQRTRYYWYHHPLPVILTHSTRRAIIR